MPLSFHLANTPYALLALVPLLLNLAVFVYGHRKLTLDAQNVLFLLFVAAASSWQAFDLSMRLAADEATAELLRGLFRPGQVIAVNIGLHFVLLYVGWERLARSPLVVAFLYLPAILQMGLFMSEVPMETLVQRPGWGWTSDVTTMHPAYRAYFLYGAVLALLCLGVLVYRLWRVWGDPSERQRVGILTLGVSFMVLIGGTLEAVFPVIGIPQWPVTSATCLAFSVSVLAGQMRFRLFDVSTPAAAKAVVDAVTDPLLITDSKGSILFANDEARSRFGLDIHRIRTYRLHDLLVSDESFDDVWSPTLTGTRHRGIESRIRLADGTTESFMLSLASIQLNRAGDLGVAVVAHDIGQIKAYEAALEEARDDALSANRSKSEFLASMSHELRTPLNVIIGYAEMLEEDTDDDRTKSDLHRIEHSGRYLLQLINDILDLSKVEAGRLEARPEDMDVADILGDLESSLQQLASTKRNELRVELDGSTRAFADPTRVRQVVLNLVSNAAKFCEDGAITVAVRDGSDDQAGELWIDIDDTGIGMNDTQAAQLFQRFNQVHDTDHDKYGGTGIGLSLSRHLCELMGGELTLHRTAPGEGSTFRATLPRTPPDAPAA